MFWDCEEDLTFKFFVDNGNQKSCEWMAKKSGCCDRETEDKLSFGECRWKIHFTDGPW